VVTNQKNHNHIHQQNSNYQIMKNIKKIKIAIWGILLTLTQLAYASITPEISSISLTIDKPGYNSSYSLGAMVYLNNNLSTIESITATHTGSSNESMGSWSLNNLGAYWWAWGPSVVPWRNGTIDGTLEINATNNNGQSSILTVPLQPDQEMEIPTATFTQQGEEYNFVATSVQNSDYYNLWIWDPIDRKYPISLTFLSPQEVTTFSTTSLISGRTYNAYYMANNRVQVNAISNLLYRSISLQYLTPQAATVPVPATFWLFGSVFGIFGMRLHRLKSFTFYQTA